MQTVRHSEHTLKTALISKNPELVKQYEQLDPREQRLLNEAFRPGSDLFGPITLHSPSDWIISHPEAPQDFEEFFSDLHRKSPSSGKQTIYIQCIGLLGNTRSISEEYLKWLKGYCEAFFYGLTVKLLEPIPVSATRCSFRVNDSTRNLQIHAGQILTFLKKKKPEDAFCVVGITMIDLYPRDSWNFVFGQASLTEGVGIFSFARYGADFHSSHFKGQCAAAPLLQDSDPRDRTHLWPPALPVARLPDARLQPPGGSRPAPTGPLPHLLTQAAECCRLPAQRPVQSAQYAVYCMGVAPHTGGCSPCLHVCVPASPACTLNFRRGHVPMHTAVPPATLGKSRRENTFKH
uniref:Archaemetzincin-2 n=1 Tax=Capra hircus TaxID=9925 RepID=A0A8C2SFF5_CAPHI